MTKGSGVQIPGPFFCRLYREVQGLLLSKNILDIRTIKYDCILNKDAPFRLFYLKNQGLESELT